MSKVSHHPAIGSLEDYAAGRLDEARAVVIASHLALCSECSAAVSKIEALGGHLLETVEPVAMAVDALEKVLARADGAAASVMQNTVAADAPPEDRLPLSALLKGSIDDVKWRPVAPGLSQSVIEAQGYREGVLRLLKIAPGVKIPPHTHKGSELTLILRGAYRDEIGEFRAGDLADLDGEHTHTPEAFGDEPCICLIATDAPLAFKTLTGKIVQPFVGL